MAVYYKKVDAIQFKLTDEQIERLNKREPIEFEGCLVKHIGGPNYVAVMQQGENLIRILESQWLVRHPDNSIQVYWPDQFKKHFIEGDSTEDLNITPQSQMVRTHNQPNTLL